ncbi:MAG: calcium-binding protein, partial [Sulfuricurvum sp.]|nr:calcium-binding protein [Sulfuricurvum sp.]
SQAGELHTLSELGITSINLTSTTSNTVSNGNIQIAAGTFTKTNGTTGESGTLSLTEDTGNAGNLNFSQNPFYSEFSDHLTLPDTAWALPNMQGSGMVRDLREASTLSANLTSTLQTMSSNYETRDEMMAQIDSLLVEWANTSTMKSGQMVAQELGGDAAYLETGDQGLYHKYLWATQHNDFSIMSADERVAAEVVAAKVERLGTIIGLLERFNGTIFSNTISNLESTYNAGNNVQINTLKVLEGKSNTSNWFYSDPLEVSLSSSQVSLLEQSYDSLKKLVYASLVPQTRLSNYIDALNFTMNENGINVDDTAMMQIITNQISTDPTNAFRDIIEIRKYAGNELGILGWSSDNALSKILAESDGVYDATNVFAEYGMIIADGSYIGNDSNSIIWGKGRDDTINAEDGIDIIYGNEGNDVLLGGGGNDTYVFNRGDGHDTISDYNQYYSNAGNDTIQFGAGITKENLIVRSNGNDLIIALKEAGKVFEELSDTITISNWYYAINRIENITFINGTILNTTEAILALEATDGNDIISGTERTEMLMGGKGDDFLQGGIGNDTYVFNRGDGHDTISDYKNIYYSDIDNDTIQFGAGVTKEDVIVRSNGNDLIIALKEEGKSFDELSDTITISNWCYANYRVENITFVNGTILNTTEAILALEATDGNDIIIGTDQSDTLYGAAGDDTINGGSGNDTYVFNRGDGHDTISDYSQNNSNDGGNDTIQFGAGITKENLIVRSNGNDLIIALKEEGKTFDELRDTISVMNWCIMGTRIENLALADGTVLNTTDAILALEATDGNDIIIGTEQSDVLAGGKGDDILQGDRGNDTYVFNRDDGHDIIYDYYRNNTWHISYDGGNDTIQFGAGITKEDVIVRSNGNDLIIALKEEGKTFDELRDTITV